MKKKRVNKEIVKYGLIIKGVIKGKWNFWDKVSIIGYQILIEEDNRSASKW